MSNLFLDLKAIKDFVFEEERRNSDVEVTETLGLGDDNKFETLSKVIREVKSSDFSNKQTIRYDMIKSFIEVLVNAGDDVNPEALTIGEKIILNTMNAYGFIVDGNDNKQG